MRCTLLTAALLVPQGAAFAPTTSARGTAKKLHAAPYERYLDAACEAARAAGALIRSASTDERAVDTLKANAKDLLTKTDCLLYTSPSPRDGLLSRMPSSA